MISGAICILFLCRRHDLPCQSASSRMVAPAIARGGFTFSMNFPSGRSARLQRFANVVCFDQISGMFRQTVCLNKRATLALWI